MIFTFVSRIKTASAVGKSSTYKPRHSCSFTCVFRFCLLRSYLTKQHSYLQGALPIEKPSYKSQLSGDRTPLVNQQLVEPLYVVYYCIFVFPPLCWSRPAQFLQDFKICNGNNCQTVDVGNWAQSQFPPAYYLSPVAAAPQLVSGAANQSPAASVALYPPVSGNGSQSLVSSDAGYFLVSGSANRPPLSGQSNGTSGRTGVEDEDRR